MQQISDLTRNLLGRGALLRRRSATGPVVPADIDMLAVALDPRLVFSSPAHAFLNSAGGVSQAAAGVWPLEYRNGAPAGRHQPEPARSNIITDNRFSTNAATAGSWYHTGGGVHAVAPGAAIDGGDGFRVTSTWNRPAIYNGASFILPDTSPWSDMQLNADWMRRRVTATFAGSVASARFYPARQDSSNYLYFQNAAGPGQVVMSVFKKDSTADNTLLLSLPQVEAGAFATSPILSGTSRPAASAVVLKDGSATGVILRFSNGDNLPLNFNGADRVQVPLSAADWGTRYITKISYVIQG